ncbi:LCP family protein [Deinococcus maricopensis]|uniref:Cell envelope-related transcriptional attenuator n=1 Tax=Deinococcus maricopensis (strain DSM 21211 / LMG 22137 / NRRL B-23946 / LB-34) TaxID=709986 RepID=E8U5Q3_DEIML|nr:LCP family protein [Deinococcus maricopensis]ADV66392.1 cell envelope-related transcriptional attenuator [Deinococcus maricopensis DSM 21211]
MPRFRVLVALALAGVTALFAPAAPALLKYGALPRTPDAPITLLLAGTTPNYVASATAAPEDYTGLTDTIVLAQFRPAEREVRLLNIPRDTWTNIPGWGYGKINGANPHGGPDLLVRAVQQVTGVGVDGYALLSLRALRDLTDAAGGVPVTVEKPMRYDDNAAKLHINLMPGEHRLNGAQAEGFLRFRHDGLGDIGRVRRQQAFLGALSARLRSPLNVWRLPAVAGALDRNVRTNVAREQVAGMLGVLLTRPNVSTTLLPGAFGPGGTWTPDRAGIRALVQERFRAPNARTATVVLRNVAAPNGTARRTKARLDGLGYADVRIENVERAAQPATLIRGPSVAAQAVARDLGFGQVQADDVDAVTVTLGADAQ